MDWFTGVNRSSVGRRYKQRFFFWDAVANVPYEVLIPGLTRAFGGDWLLAIAVARLPKLCRLQRLFYYLEHMDRYVSELPIHIEGGLLAMVKVTLAWTYSAHVWACTWIMLARYAESSVERTWLTIDSVRVPGLTTASALVVYGRAFFFVIETSTSCGLGGIPQVCCFARGLRMRAGYVVLVSVWRRTPWRSSGRSW